MKSINNVGYYHWMIAFFVCAKLYASIVNILSY